MTSEVETMPHRREARYVGFEPTLEEREMLDYLVERDARLSHAISPWRQQSPTLRRLIREEYERVKRQEALASSAKPA